MVLGTFGIPCPNLNTPRAHLARLEVGTIEVNTRGSAVGSAGVRVVTAILFSPQA